MIWVGVPHPCEGRCWNRPSESRSPLWRSRRPDSVMAAMTAIRAAWLFSSVEAIAADTTGSARVQVWEASCATLSNAAEEVSWLAAPPARTARPSTKPPKRQDATIRPVFTPPLLAVGLEGDDAPAGSGHPRCRGIRTFPLRG